jgi:hypothetical protein
LTSLSRLTQSEADGDAGRSEEDHGRSHLQHKVDAGEGKVIAEGEEEVKDEDGEHRHDGRLSGDLPDKRKGKGRLQGCRDT